MSAVLEIQNFSIYNLFSNFSLSFEKGMFTVLIGPNMCGKTTLIKTLAGILPSKEAVLLERCYIESIDPSYKYQKLAVILSVDDACFFLPKVEEEIKFVLENLNLGEDGKKIRFQEVVKKYHLHQVLSKSPKELTRFQKVKLLLALTTITESSTFLLDDPLRALTRSETEEILSYLIDLKKCGKTIIMTTDNFEDTYQADRVVVLNEGEVILDGSALDVMKEDGILNRIGLRLPFLVDLSVKLQYYNLIDSIYLNPEELVDAVWKSN